MSSHEVRFPAELKIYAWGRNGAVASAGIEVRTYTYDPTPCVELRNITSKGDVSDAARLVIPIAAVPQLIAILQRLSAGPLGRLALDLP